MRRLGIAITLGLLLAGTSAYAQDSGVSNLSYSVKTTSKFPPSPTETQQASASSGSIDASGSSSSAGSRTTYSAYVLDNDDDTITFENSTISGGTLATATATSTVAFSFYDRGDVLFESLITPAGLGFYLANMEGCELSACPLIATGPGLPTLADVLGTAAASFNFAITDTIGDEVFTLFAVSGVLTLENGVLTKNTTNEGALAGFEPAYFSQPQAYGFHWDETLVPRTLAGGVTHNLSYVTSVSSSIATDSVTSPCGAGLVGYAGFGDPIGRGGALFGALFPALIPCAVDLLTGPPGIDFTPLTVPKPVFENGVLRFGALTVPEPTTWAMMILGFAGIGAAIRRRRALGAHA